MRPTGQATFPALNPAMEGPYTLAWTALHNGCLNVMVYDRTNDRYLPFTGVTGGPAGMAYITGPGNTIAAMNGSEVAGQTIAHTATVSVPAGTDPAALEVHVTATGNWIPSRPPSSQDLEEISNIQLSGLVPGGAGSCCNCYATLLEIASLLSANDPGVTWTVDGDRVCTTVLLAQAEQYGDLVFCEGTFSPTLT
jgi:hypothetical protein